MKPTTRLVALGLAVVPLYLGFSANTWHAADQTQFLHQLRDTESLVVGRLVKTRQDGLLSAGGLTGAGMPNDIHRDWINAEQASHQFSAYLDGSAFDDFSPYLSQIGGQAMMFGLLDTVTPLSPRSTLRLLHGLTSLLSALALALIVLWFFEEFGTLTAVAVLCSILLSSWLTIFGRNLWWSTWAFYLPMVGVMYYLRLASSASSGLRRLGALAFCLIAIKCFINGYEFITTTVLMMVVPLVYHDLAQRTEAAELMRRSAAMFIGAGAAIGASLAVLSVQIASELDGSIVAGWRHIGYALGKRTYGSGDDYSGLVVSSHAASVTDVIGTYVNGVYVDTTHLVSALRLYRLRFLLEHEIGYGHLLALFALASLGLLALRNGFSSPEMRSKSAALVMTVWVSLAAPMSWYLIFKGHSAIHTHLNYLLWQMPFTLFGFAVVGLVLRELVRGVLRRATGWVRRPLGDARPS